MKSSDIAVVVSGLVTCVVAASSAAVVKEVLSKKEDSIPPFGMGTPRAGMGGMGMGMYAGTAGMGGMGSQSMSNMGMGGMPPFTQQSSLQKGLDKVKGIVADAAKKVVDRADVLFSDPKAEDKGIFGEPKDGVPNFDDTPFGDLDKK